MPTEAVTRADRLGVGSITPAVERGLAWVDRRAQWVFALLALLAFGEILYLGRHGSFFQDEWAFINVNDLSSPSAWLAPHNEHWSTVPMLLYRAVFAVVGLRSHLPYFVLLLVLHVSTAFGLFVLVRRMSGGLVALAASGLFLFLGSAYSNLFWAFQIGFVGSCAAGLWALVALERGDRRGAAAGALLLMVAVMSSGVGLAFLAMAFVELLLDRPRRWMAVWITPVAVVFVVWFLTFGRSGLSAGDTIGVPTLQRIPSYVLSGAVGAIRGLTAFGTGTSLALLAVAVAAAVALLLRRRLPPRAVAAACGLAVFFALIAIGREASPSPGGTPRYVYESALFVILAAAALIGRTADVAGRPLVSVSRSPATLLIALGILAIVVHGFPKNQADLRGGSAFFTDKAGELRAYVGDVGPSPAFDFAAPAIAVPLGIPQPDQMVGLIDRYGSPASDVLWPSVALKPTPAQRDRAFWRLAGGQAVVTTDAAAPPAGGAPPVIESFAGDRLETVGACVRATAPETISMTVGLPPGASVSVQPTDSATGTATFGREAAPQPVNVVSLPLTGGSWTRLRAPTATGSDYHAALEIPSPGPVTVCTTPGG